MTTTFTNISGVIARCNYRLFTHFQVVLGSHEILMTVSYCDRRRRRAGLGPRFREART